MGTLTDLTAARKGLAAAAAAVTGLRTQHFAPMNNVSPPLFAVGECTNEFDLVMHRGADEWLFECRLYAANIDDPRTATEKLDTFLNPGAGSIKAALEADRTLGGVVAALRVERIKGYAIYTVGTASFIGARFDVRVW